MTTNINCAAGAQAIGKAIIELKKNKDVEKLFDLLGLLQPHSPSEFGKYICRSLNRMMVLPVEAQYEVFQLVAEKFGELVNRGKVYDLAGIGRFCQFQN